MTALAVTNEGIISNEPMLFSKGKHVDLPVIEELLDQRLPFASEPADRNHRGLKESRCADGEPVCPFQSRVKSPMLWFSLEDGNNR